MNAKPYGRKRGQRVNVNRKLQGLKFTVVSNTAICCSLRFPALDRGIGAGFPGRLCQALAGQGCIDSA